MKDMTIGSPLKHIVYFIIPLLIGNIFQQMYGLVDTVIVGRTLGTGALGAIGAVGGLTYFVQGFVLGIASGLSLVLAQRFGAKVEDRIRSSYVTSVWISVSVVIIMTALSVSMADDLLLWMNIPSELFDQSKAYFVTAMLGLTVTMIFSLFCNILRSMGNTTQLLFFTILSQILNILFDILFIVVFHMGVKGVALATVASQLLVGFLCQKYLAKEHAFIKWNKQSWKINRKEINLHLNISIPIGLQSAIISVGTILLQFKLNGLGTAAIEGHAIGARIENMVTIPLVTIGMATATYAAQNYGAGEMDRIWQGVKLSTSIAIGYAVVMGSLLFFFGGDLAASLFSANRNETIHYVENYFKMTTPFYVFLSFLFVYRFTLQGMGRMVAPTLSGFMEMIIRSMVPLVLTGLIGFPAIVFSHPLSWLTTALISAVSLRFVKRNDDTHWLKRFLTR